MKAIWLVLWALWPWNAEKLMDQDRDGEETEVSPSLFEAFFCPDLLRQEPRPFVSQGDYRFG